MSNLLQEIEEQITGVKTATSKQSMRMIREIGDKMARIEELTDTMLNEMIDLDHGITDLALNLDETEVEMIILSDYTQLQKNGEIRTTGKLLQIPMNKKLLGRVVNTLDEPL